MYDRIVDSELEAAKETKKAGPYEKAAVMMKAALALARLAAADAATLAEDFERLKHQLVGKTPEQGAALLNAKRRVRTNPSGGPQAVPHFRRLLSFPRLSCVFTGVFSCKTMKNEQEAWKVHLPQEKIEHMVVLFVENRATDHLFGAHRSLSLFLALFSLFVSLIFALIFLSHFSLILAQQAACLATSPASTASRTAAAFIPRTRTTRRTSPRSM
jgi:hypothetical protein